MRLTFNIRLFIKFLKRSKMPLFLLFVSLGFLGALPFFPEGAWYARTIHRLAETGLIASAAWLLLSAARVIRDEIYEIFDISASDNRVQRRVRTQIDFIYRLVAVIIITVGTAIFLTTFESARKIGASVIASAGIASVVIGFAAQRSLSNLIAGFQIAFTQPMRIDDVVVVEKEWGRIEEITLTYVVVKIWDLRRLVLPLNYFLEKPFENWTRVSADILAPFFIYVDYNAPIAAIRAELERAAHDSKFWDRNACKLQVTDFREDSIQLRVLLSARNASDAFELRCEVRERLLDTFRDRVGQVFPLKRWVDAGGELRSGDEPPHLQA